MAATYDISSHRMLNAQADDYADANPAEFDALVEAAEGLLGLAGTAYTGSDLLVAKLALVYQVNFMVLSDGADDLLESETKGDRSQTFRGGAISPKAQQLVNRLKGVGGSAIEPPSSTGITGNAIW